MVEVLNGRFVLKDDAPVRHGGSAVVKKATDIDRGGFVAVKLLTGAADGVVRKLFEREVELLRQTDHPNIVKFVDSGVDETGTPYVVLAWVENNLAEVLGRTTPLPWDRFMAEVLRPLADAVAYLHRQSIEHRDIKAINVLADDSDRPLLADFGIAKLHDDEATSRTVANFGTYLWTPPEGPSAQPYLRDVFALGVMCIYGMSPTEARPQSYEGLGSALADLELPDGLRELIATAVDRDPARRPQNAIHFLNKLDSAVAALRPAPQKTRIYLGLTNAARRHLVGDDGILDRADSILLRDFGDEVWVSMPWDNVLRQFNPNTFFVTGTELKVTAKRDPRYGTFAVTSVVRPEYEELERDRDRGMAVSDFISWTTLQPIEMAPARAAYELLLGRVNEHHLERDSEAANGRGIEQIVSAWRRLLDAREAIASEELGEIEFADVVERSAKETQFTLLEEREDDLLGTEWQILDENRGRAVMKGTVVHHAGTTLAIRWSWRRLDKIPKGSRLRAYLGASTTALNRQRDALLSLENGTSALPELASLLSDPQEARPPRPKTDIEWKSQLDESKQLAVQSALGLDDCMVVTGPPGTGKTRFIAETVSQFLTARPEARVLIVSQTHVAIDNAIERLSESGLNGIVRIGQTDDPRISELSRGLILEERVADWAGRTRTVAAKNFASRAALAGVNQAHLRAILALEEYSALRAREASLKGAIRSSASAREETAARLDLAESPVELERQLDDVRDRAAKAFEDARAFLATDLTLPLDASGSDVEAVLELLLEQSPAARNLVSLLKLQSEWLLRLDGDSAIADLYLRSAHVVAGTCLGVLRNKAVRNLEFDLCIVDEASKATSTEALVPIVRAKRFVLVGDESQLPPVDEDLLHRQDVLDAHDLNADFVRQTLFSRLVHELPERNKFILSEQYRMIAPIGNLISACFYDGAVSSPRTEGVSGYDHLGKPVTWIDTSASPRRREDTDASHPGSYANRFEADLAVKRLRSINKAIELGLLARRPDGRPYEVLLIAPYRGQLDELSRRLEREHLTQLTVDVESVDAVQGREADFVVFSITRSNSRESFGFLGSGFWRRINVALSRARFGLTIVGDTDFSASERGALSRVLGYMRQHPADCEIRGADVSE